MGGYKKPKRRLHREFLFLNHESVINSLSAIESGMVDEIIQKVSESRDGGLEAGVSAGPVRLSGGKKSASSVEEELRVTRTRFSAFDAWFKSLVDGDAIGRLESWDGAVREELEVGDTIEFRAVLSLSPLQQVLLTYIAFAAEASNPNSPLKQPSNKVADIKKTSRMMEGWIRGKGDSKSVMVYMAPLGVRVPTVATRLEEEYLVAGAQAIEGEYTVVAQVEQIIAEGDSVPAIRVVRDVPPTPMEIETVTTALRGFIESAKALGVQIEEGDITLRHPGVVLRTIAVFR